MNEMYHLVLKNGYRFNELALNAGEIYTTEQFDNVSEQRMVALILGRIIYRGSLQDVKSKREKLFGIRDENTDLPKKEAKGKAAI